MFICHVLYIVAAENIPRTLNSVYRRAQRLFDPKVATLWCVEKSVAIC